MLSQPSESSKLRDGNFCRRNTVSLRHYVGSFCRRNFIDLRQTQICDGKNHYQGINKLHVFYTLTHPWTSKGKRHLRITLSIYYLLWRSRFWKTKTKLKPNANILCYLCNLPVLKCVVYVVQVNLWSKVLQNNIHGRIMNITLLK